MAGRASQQAAIAGEVGKQLAEILAKQQAELLKLTQEMTLEIRTQEETSDALDDRYRDWPTSPTDVIKKDCGECLDRGWVQTPEMMTEKACSCQAGVAFKEGRE